MDPAQTRTIQKAIDENTRELKTLGKILDRHLKRPPAVVPQAITGPEEGGLKTEDIPDQVVIHRPEEWSRGYVFKAACSDKVLVDESVLTVSLNEAVINCPSCKNL